ncbi:MAG: glycosyltransferase family 4 protein [Balneolales bacterium]
MKILLLSQYFPPETGAGATRSEALFKYLTEFGWEVEVIAEIPNYPTGKIQKGYSRKFVQSEVYGSSRINRVWVWTNPRKNNWQKLIIFVSFLSSSLLFAMQHNRRYDVIYATSPPIFTGISGCLIAKLYRTRFVLEVRDLWPDAALSSNGRPKKSFFHRLAKTVERWLYRNANLVVPVTTPAQRIIEHENPAVSTQVIANGIDTSLFKKISHPEHLMDEPYDKTKFRVGYLGTFGVIHDLVTLIRAAKLCEDDPGIEFILVGDGSARGALDKALKEIKPNNVTILGLKQHRQVPSYISSFDLAVNPVHDKKVFESIITVKFYEYLACQVPVLSMARGLMREEGNASGAAVTIDPENPELLAATIKKLKNDPDVLEEMRQRSKDYINENHDRRYLAKLLSEKLIQLSINDSESTPSN